MSEIRSTTTFGRSLVSALFCLLVPLLINGCGDSSKPQVAAPSSPIEVKVADVVQEKIPILMPFAGTVQSINVVDIIPRVSGYIEEIYFQDGTYVKKGDALYQIDPRPFQAQLDALEAQLKQDQAKLVFWTSEAERYTRLEQKGYGSEEGKEKAIAQRNETAAKLNSDKANIENAKLNLSFTLITAPFHGRIENTQKYPGALVQEQRDVLTTLVQLNPIYVIFNMNRRHLATVQELEAKGLAPTKLEDFKVEVFLPDGTKHDQRGYIDFISVQLDPKTDTTTVRAVFPNEDANQYQVRLIPGQYVPLQLIAGYQPDAILIPQAALVQSQIGSHVFVVDKDGKVETRPVEVDRSYDNQWVIHKGLKKGERVVVEGVQKVRSGVVVKASEMKVTADSQS